MEYEQLAGKGRPLRHQHQSRRRQGAAARRRHPQAHRPDLPLRQLYAVAEADLDHRSARWQRASISNIAPEEGTQWETGIKFDSTSGSPARWRSTTSTRRTCWSRSSTARPEPTNCVTAGKARSRGVEFDVTGKLTDHWSMIGSYGYTDARVTDDPDPCRQGAAERRAEHGLALSRLRLRHGVARPASARRRRALCRRPAGRCREHVRPAVLCRRRHLCDLRDQTPERCR